MLTIRAAFASDDGVTFTPRHFGDADFYEIFEIQQSKAEYIKRIVNDVEIEEETAHGDPRKAGGIAAILKKENINTAVSNIFWSQYQADEKTICIVSSFVNARLPMLF